MNITIIIQILKNLKHGIDTPEHLIDEAIAFLENDIKLNAMKWGISKTFDILAHEELERVRNDQ